MPIIKMEIIAEPAPGTAAILVPSSGLQVIMKGNGNMIYVCGACGAHVLEYMEKGQVKDMIFKCNKCKNFNKI